MLAVLAGATLNAQGEKQMFGMIGKIQAAAGKREELIALLLSGATGMAGCLSYVVAKDAADENTIWVTEAWDSAASHEASLKLTSVREAIAKARPLIAGFDTVAKTIPVGGVGLKSA